MTRFLRPFVLLALALATVTAPATLAAAQNELDPSACWAPGALTDVSGATMTWSTPPATIIDPAQSYSATISTIMGDIVIALDAANAPIATNNFICLALAGFYTGVDFHRIAADLFIQAGDPSGTGDGGPGYTIRSDPTTGPYPAGAVAMANAAPNENGSQFFITATNLTGLIPANYPVFGQVVAGLDVVAMLSRGAVQPNAAGENTKPVDPVMILSVTIASGPIAATAASTAPPPESTAIGPTPTPESGSTGAVEVRPESGEASASVAPSATAVDVASAFAAGCTGLEAYTTAFDDAYVNNAFANPDALSFLMEMQQSDGSQSMFEIMTPDQASAMSAFYLSVSEDLEQIVPPPFAAQWHGVQIEIFHALSDFSANIASQGLAIASIQASPILQDLTSRSDAALAVATAACADFQQWIDGGSDEAA